MKIYNILAGIPFARALAAGLLARADGSPEALCRMRVLLPTRRACRSLRESFPALNGGKPLLLPRMQPLGDVDEEELFLEAPFLPDLPPAIDPLQRRILLTRAVMARADFRQGPAHALALAGSLARLMDRIHTESLDLAALPALAGEEFAAHWQVTVDFLTILSREWPAVLDSLGVIDAADRRNRLLTALAAHWEENPPPTPVIAAGSTGSIPATARLLKVIAALPEGAVVLPGLDTAMDGESLAALDDTHPQATLRHLLESLGIGRTDVKPWPAPQDEKISAARRALATELMRPAATAGAWAKIKTGNPDALRGLTRCDADTPQEEAQVIAALMRKTLEEPGRTAALVTPDRALARRVAMACRRWGLEIDDSAGNSLPETNTGVFLHLVAQACLDRLAPASLLALLRHELCRLGMTGEELAASGGRLELAGLRGPKPPPGLEGLRNRLAEKKRDKESALMDLLDRLEKKLSPFLTLTAQGDVPFSSLLDAHIAATESLAETPDVSGAERLWRGESGEAAALFLSSLREQAQTLPPMNAEDYLAVLGQFMKDVTVRPAHGAHPRLSILGQLEARLLQADLVILGGLNEGTWPPVAGHDPWMSRPMMAQFGLPSPERGIGLAAHDFVQGFCAENVVLTRARRTDGAPSVPARWLQRLDTVLQAQGADPATLHRDSSALLAALRASVRAEKQIPAPRPAPAPPVDLRPRKLSVTEIETWLRDPYSIYARHVLKLKKLDPLEKPPDVADRGTLLHDTLKDFITACKTELPGDAKKILLDLGSARLAKRADDPGFWDFWWPRFERLAGWLVENERDWRARATPLALEADGALTLDAPAGAFALTVRADRIDRMTDGTCAVIDYKSGGAYPVKQMKAGVLPQLPLEALILEGGGFEGVPASSVGYLGYIVATGGEPPGKIVALENGLPDVLTRTREGLEALVARFDDPATPYHNLPDPDRPLRFNKYEQLSRLQEWTAPGEAEDAA